MPPKRLTTPSASKIAPFEVDGRRCGGVGRLSHRAPSPPACRTCPAGRNAISRIRISPTMMNRRAVIRVSDSGRSRKQQALEHRPEDDRSDCDPPVAGKPAEDQHRIADEGDDRHELVRDDELQVEGEEEARDRSQRGGDRQRLELVGEGVLAQRARGVLVLADRAQHPAPGRLLGPAERERSAESPPPRPRGTGGTASGRRSSRGRRSSPGSCPRRRVPSCR